MNNCRGCKGKKQVHGRPREMGLRAEYPNEIVVVYQAFLKDSPLLLKLFRCTSLAIGPFNKYCGRTYMIYFSCNDKKYSL